MPNVEVSLAAEGGGTLSPRSFELTEGLSRLFEVLVLARSAEQLDVEAMIGSEATFRFQDPSFSRTLEWRGICPRFELLQSEPSGLSTYRVTITPTAWLLTQRRGHSIHQHLSIPDIVDRILDGWGIPRVWRVARDDYSKWPYKVQYGETDYSFMRRLLAEAGIAFFFEEGKHGPSTLTFADALQLGELRRPKIPWADNPNDAIDHEFVAELSLSQEVVPTTFAFGDFDFRHPTLDLAASSGGAVPGRPLEQRLYDPGAFLVETSVDDGGTPVADDRGAARADARVGARLADLARERAFHRRRRVGMRTNALDVGPGVRFGVEQHPHADLSADLLVVERTLQYEMDRPWNARVEAGFNDVPYRPAQDTSKPTVDGVQSATVVGPSGEEIHTDEFGRVRLQFPWDREGANDDTSSAWVRVSQGWAGTGFGIITIPRVGQEVLVAFLEGDPDQPVVVGRVFNGTNPVPYDLPQNKTRSTWKSRSSPGGAGFNELMFEDLAGQELVWLQAERDLRKLVKHDETITVGGGLQKLVKQDEIESVLGDRFETTEGLRVELDKRDRINVVGGSRRELVRSDAVTQIDGNQLLRVGFDRHVFVAGVKRELVERERHVLVRGDRHEQVGGSYGLTAGSHQIACGSQAVAAGNIHLKAGAMIVIEAPDITLKAPGGFIRIDGSGVTIQGSLVKINSGGSPGILPLGGGGDPEPPLRAEVEIPDVPQPEDVSISGLGR